MLRPLPPSTFRDLDTVAIARSLLGKALVREGKGEASALLVTEVEAYDSERDLACHASKGRTARTDVLYRAGGIWYVYLCYGIHEMLNLVTGPAGHPAAVLIRGVAGINGPGRVTKRLQIGRALNGQPAKPGCGLYLADAGVKVSSRRIVATPRIGIDYAGPVWARKKWRFYFEPSAEELPAVR
ncbi:MAG TPA: DNA-3-methyladenine glycosylase [Lacunisphaera sp.]|nr:DNA-3-methyladenine glycosylase [Lacunisphaera sp.]